MITIYGIKSCDTCRKALKWLDGEGIAHRYHDLHIDDVFESVKLALRPWTRGKKLYNQKDLNSPPEGETNEQPKIEDKTTGDTAQIRSPVAIPASANHSTGSPRTPSSATPPICAAPTTRPGIAAAR